MHRLGRNLIVALACSLVLTAIFADFLSPNDPRSQNLEYFYAPPTAIHWGAPGVEIPWGPYIHPYQIRDLVDVVYEEDLQNAIPLRLFAEGWEYRLFGIIPAKRHLLTAGSGGPLYLLGTDALGRDVLARILAGGRTSLAVLVVGFLLYCLIGVPIGIAAAISGGWIDTVLMRFSEFVLALPTLYLILAIRALLPLRLEYWETVVLTVAVIASVTWPPLARGVRGILLQLQNTGYIEAARSLGAPPLHIIRRHVIPALVPYTLAQGSLAAPAFVLGEVILSYLKVGFGENEESWGAMLQAVQDPRVLTDFWWNLAPIGFIFAGLLCLNLLTSRPEGTETRRSVL